MANDRTDATAEHPVSRQVLLSLRQIIRAMDLRSRQLEKSVGLTVPQLVVLKEVAGEDGIPIGHIARQISLSQATVTTIVDRLEHRGAVERRRTESDRRRVLVFLTELGAALIRSSPTILQEEFLQAFSRLESWEQTQMLATLQRVAAMMKAEDLSATPILTVDPLSDPPPSRPDVT
jgi:DNA-binding MarR family transcriptional regulator